MRVKIHRALEHTLIAGSTSSWVVAEEQYSRSSTSRREMKKAVEGEGVHMSASVEASMKAGSSFPIKVVEVSAEISTTLKSAVERSIETSSEVTDTYSEETEESTRTKTVATYAPQTINTNNGKPMEDLVVYKESWMLGSAEIKVKYLSESVKDFKKMKKDEILDVTMQVGVDYQWYRLVPSYWYDLEGKMRALGLGCCISSYYPYSHTFDQYNYDQHWRYTETKQIVSRNGPMGGATLVPSHNFGTHFVGAYESSPSHYLGFDTWNIFNDGRIQLASSGECLYGLDFLILLHCDTLHNSWSFVPVPDHNVHDESSSIV